MKTKFLIFMFTLLFCFSPIVHASDSMNKNWFSTVQINLNPSYTLSLGDLDDYWESDPGLDFTLNFPYLHGHIRALLIYQPLSSKDINQRPDMTTMQYGFGYAYLWDISEKLNLSTGLDYVLYKMNAVDPGQNVGYRWQFDELEAGLSLTGGATYRFSDRFGINLEARHSVVFTYTQTNITSISAGISYRFNSPNWLREGLK